MGLGPVVTDAGDEAGIAPGETRFDRLLGFTIPDRHARGRIVRLGPMLDLVLSAHDYPPPIRDLLAEALVLTALIGGLLDSEGGQLTVQATSQGEAPRGVVELLVCDYRAGELRGYVRHDAQRLATLGKRPSLRGLFGEGYLAITFDRTPAGQRYQGIVPLDGASLAQACQAYFSQSEQVPTLIRVGVSFAAGKAVAGGLLVQHLAEGEEGRMRLHVRMDHPEWEHVATLAGSTRSDELADPDLSLEALVWRLFHEERVVRAEPGARITRGCRCTAAHYREVLERFPEDDRASMRGDDGLITVDCAFCSRLFPIEA